MLLLEYGVDEDGDTMVWNLAPDAVEPHALVVGTTGSGKTKAMFSLVLDACRRGYEVVIVDPKRIEFMGLRDWPNVTFVATAVEEMVAAIHRHHQLMEDRYEMVERQDASEDDFEPVILVLDEFRNFVRQVTAWYAATKVKGMPAKCPVFDLIPALAEKGRTSYTT